MRYNIKDVAKRAGVSISTVSRVLNSPQSVKEDKRNRIEAAIKELNYYPNALARGLIHKRTDSIGVLIPDISNSYAAEVIKGMEKTAHEMKVSLIICNTERDYARMQQYLEVLKEKQVDGIIYTSEPVNDTIHDLFTQLGVPVVLASTESMDFNLPSVKVDDEQAGYDGAEYLINAGHKEVAMISGPTTDPIAGFPRFMGFKQAIKNNLQINNIDHRVEFGNYRYEDGYTAMKNLYKKNNKITGVFAASDEMALGAISYLHEEGINVPEDVSVLGFDNTKIATMSIPKLTTVAQPMFEIGSTAVKKLNQLLNGTEGGSELNRLYLNHKIIERDSVKKIQINSNI